MRNTTMTGLAVALAILLAAGGAVQAGLIAVDDFESYTSGNPLDTGSGGWGWTSSWATDPAEVTVESGKISGYGQSMQIDTAGNNGNIAQRAFHTQNGTVYAGLVLRTAGGWDAGDFLQLYVNDKTGGGDTVGASGGVKNATGSPYFARLDGTGSSANSPTTFHTDDVTRQVVLKFSRSGAEYDRTDVFVGQATEGTPDATQNTGDSGVCSLSNFHIRTHGINEGQFIYVDSVKIGTAYADVLGTAAVPPAPSTQYEAFQEGVSPSAGYTADSVTIRSDIANGNQDNDPDFENIVGRVGSDFMRVLHEFDLSEIASQAGGLPVTIDSARLELVTRPRDDGSGQGGAFTVDLLEYGFDFVESTATWNDPDGDGSAGTGDTTAGGTLGALLSSVAVSGSGISGNSLVTLADSAAFRTAVANALAGGDDTLRLLMKAQNESGSGNRFISFRDEVFATADYRPKLVVGFTVSSGVIPEPATMLAVFAGIAGLGGYVRKRKAFTMRGHTTLTLLLAAALILAAGGAARAALLAYDPIDTSDTGDPTNGLYDDGAPIRKYSSGTNTNYNVENGNIVGFAADTTTGGHDWASTNTALFIANGSAGLTAAGADYAGGGAVRYGGHNTTTDRGIRRSFLDSVTRRPVADGETLYFSFLLKAEGTDSSDYDGQALVGFADSAASVSGLLGTNNNVYGPAVGFVGDGSEMDLVYRHRTDGNKRSDIVLVDGVTTGTTYQVVAKITANASGWKDSYAVFLNPTTGTEPAPLLAGLDGSIGTSTSPDQRIDRILMATRDYADAVVFDEFRYGQTWADVVSVSAPIPEPATMAAVFAGIAGLGGYIKKRRS